MKYLPLFLFLFCLGGCKRESTVSTNFDQIDVTIFNGWTDVYSIKVINTGKTYVFNEKYKKGKTYYTMTLGKNELDSLSKMTDIIFKTQIDTLYTSRCVDCGAFNLIIKSKDQLFKSSVNGIGTYSQEFDKMNSLVFYLYQIAEKSKNMLDSVFVFESRIKGFYPPPAPPQIDETDSK